MCYIYLPSLHTHHAVYVHIYEHVHVWIYIYMDWYVMCVYIYVYVYICIYIYILICMLYRFDEYMLFITYHICFMSDCICMLMDVDGCRSIAYRMETYTMLLYLVGLLSCYNIIINVLELSLTVIILFFYFMRRWMVLTSNLQTNHCLFFGFFHFT